MRNDSKAEPSITRTKLSRRGRTLRPKRNQRLILLLFIRVIAEIPVTSVDRFADQLIAPQVHPTRHGIIVLRHRNSIGREIELAMRTHVVVGDLTRDIAGVHVDEAAAAGDVEEAGGAVGEGGRQDHGWRVASATGLDVCEVAVEPGVWATSWNIGGEGEADGLVEAAYVIFGLMLVAISMSTRRTCMRHDDGGRKVVHGMWQ